MNASFQFDDANVPFVYDGRDRMVLPKQYSPGPDVVIIGRGKRVQQHQANIRFRALIESQLEAYSNAATKGLKSNILWRVLNEVRGYSSSRLGFVKRDSDTGRWYAIDDATAKVNISQAFRDGLSNSYLSSKKRKQQKRKKSLEEENAKNEESKLGSTGSFLPGMDRFETNPDSASHKRVRLARNESIGEASESSGHLAGRLGSAITMDRLQQFLSGGSTIPVEIESNQLKMSLKQSPKTNSWDTFSKLLSMFGSSDKLSENPFEPQPISTFSQRASLPMSRRNFKWDDRDEVDTNIPRFPIADRVNRTHSPGDFSVTSNIFDPVLRIEGPGLPSIHSSNAHDVTESAAIEMTSFSSLSDVSEDQDRARSTMACV